MKSNRFPCMIKQNHHINSWWSQLLWTFSLTESRCLHLLGHFSCFFVQNSSHTLIEKCDRLLISSTVFGYSVRFWSQYLELASMCFRRANPRTMLLGLLIWPNHFYQCSHTSILFATIHIRLKSSIVPRFLARVFGDASSSTRSCYRFLKPNFGTHGLHS